MSFRSTFTVKRILIGLLILLAAIQIIRIDKTNPSSNTELDLISITNPTPKIGALLKSTCYDCHSHQTKYPWYTNIAPVSWWMKNHVNEGREELNFSLWANYTAKKKDYKLEECIEMIKEGEMPLSSYTWIHPESNLTDGQKAQLTNWFQSLRQNTEDTETD